MKSRGMVFGCLLVISMALLAMPASAQVQNGIFTGTVTDPQGASAPEAEVQIINVGTNFTVTVKTNSDGLYRAAELPPGTYRITVKKAGFKGAVKTNLILSAGTIERVDFTLELGDVSEVVTVEATQTGVETEDSKLAITVSNVATLPLNGRNVYSLNQLAPGAINAAGVMFENSDRGTTTIVNGVRSNFSGYLINGVSNKGLSGGASTLPNPDIVQEFQELTLNMSAQYGNSAGSVSNLVTKSGTNTLHGSAFYFLRNDAFDANEFFRNKNGVDKAPVRFNQFGASVTGAIIKDKLFFTGSYQGERFRTQAGATEITVESPEWRQAISSLFPTSTAGFLYDNFGPQIEGTPSQTLDEYVTSGDSGRGFTQFGDYFCPSSLDPSALNGGGATTLANRFASLFGVTAADQAYLTGGTSASPNCATYFGTGGPALQAGAVSRTMPFLGTGILAFGSQTDGNLVNGNEWSSRIDWVRKNDRVFGEFYWQKTTDSFGPPNANSGIRAFGNPQEIYSPNFQFSYLHTFSPSWLNEFRFGFARNRNDITTETAGVPYIVMLDGSAGFGSYNGYPQFFSENVYTYSDMMSFQRGKHSMKAGADFRRNLENSEFNVARPSYYFFDPLFFSLDAPFEQVAGVDPGFASGQPAQLASSIRYWRNLEFGAFFQDDWKISKRLTLNLGVRYDLYSRHKEKNNRVTTFIPGPGGATAAQDFFLEWIQNANIPAGLPGCDTPDQVRQAQLAGACGPGGFAAVTSLGGSDHNNIGPRVGAAYDLFGNAKTVLRGGFGVSYEGTLYNPLSNSRWNLPFYSFNDAVNFLGEDTNNIIYGPQTPGEAPTFSGPPTNPGQGSGAQAVGNLSGWDANNSNLAFLTGIVFPAGIKDPYILNFYFGIQREVLPNTVLEVNYVGTRGRKLFRAEQGNRISGGRLPEGTCVQAQGRELCSLRNTDPGEPGSGVSAINPSGRLNPNYGTLRIWDNVSKSSYNSLQASLRRSFSRGLQFSANYTWSHSIDTGSDWHSSATSANGGAAGDGYSLDPTRPFLEKGNSTFDVRHRFVANFTWELPWMRAQKDLASKAFGGWQLNGIVATQTGAHWTPWNSRDSNSGGDYNLDGVANDRPDALTANNVAASKDQYANGYFGQSAVAEGFFGTPCTACNGTLGRNTFVGPGLHTWDISVFKTFPITERLKLVFRAEMFNAFNRVNFLMPDGRVGQNRSNRITNSNFGQANGTQGPRQIQFGLRFSF